MADFEIERSLLAKGYRAIAGLDEAGRGALFGPVVAAAVIFPKALIERDRQEGWWREVDDSKCLTSKKRKKLFKSILINAHALGWGLASHCEIDQNNIRMASFEAMKRAVEKMSFAPDFLLVDGFMLNDVNYSQKKVFQGDKRSISIAAASIVAKVLRDEIIIQLGKIFEGYSLPKNKGYGTRQHYLALQELGSTTFHRMSFNLGCSDRK